MKNSQVIQRLQSLYSKGLESDDSRLSNRLIYNKLLTVRNKLVMQKKNKRQKLSNWLEQTLPCVELIEVLPHECPCLPPVGCKVLRSRFPIPQPLTYLSGDGINRVVSLDNTIVIDKQSQLQTKYQEGNRYTSTKPNYYIHQEYLYVTMSFKIKLVSITGVFAEPILVELFPSYCDTPDCTDCTPCMDILDMAFPADDTMIEDIISVSLNELINGFNSAQQDITNNAKD